MPQFDVYLTREGDLLLDCQTNLLIHLNSRFVVPLQPPTETPALSSRLNPTFVVQGQDRVMKTHFAAAVPVRSLGKVVTSLADQRYAIIAALDMLLTGV